jgi:hypothetical protein
MVDVGQLSKTRFYFNTVVPSQEKVDRVGFEPTTSASSAKSALYLRSIEKNNGK